MYKKGIFTIVSNELIGRDVYRMVLAGDTSDLQVPGRFVNIELDGLLEENISAVANSLGFTGIDVSLDTIFPLKSILSQQAGNMRATYRDAESGKTYVNIPVAFYGGGLNLSRVTFQGYENAKYFSGEAEVDLLDTYLNLTDTSSYSTIKGLMLKTVITVSGVEPFSFYFVKEGYLYGEAPKMADLIANAKGE